MKKPRKTSRLTAEELLLFPFYDSLASETDRGVALASADYLDSLLAALLRQVFVDEKDIVEDRLLGQDRPLGSFSARTDLAYAIGLLPQDVYEALTAVRVIRNFFAHNYEKCSFDLADLDPWCDKLQRLDLAVIEQRLESGEMVGRLADMWRGAVPRANEESNREKFESAILWLGFELPMRALRGRNAQPGVEFRGEFEDEDERVE